MELEEMAEPDWSVEVVEAGCVEPIEWTSNSPNWIDEAPDWVDAYEL